MSSWIKNNIGVSLEHVQQKITENIEADGTKREELQKKREESLWLLFSTIQFLDFLFLKTRNSMHRNNSKNLMKKLFGNNLRQSWLLKEFNTMKLGWLVCYIFFWIRNGMTFYQKTRNERNGEVKKRR